MKIGFVSLGCPKNLVDSEVMMGSLAAHGHELTPHPEEAEVIVVNTCSFIDPAKQESVETIIEMGRYKETGKAKRLVVAGCLVERFRGEIEAQLPEVDALVGTNEIEKIVQACEGEKFTPESTPYLYHDLSPRILTTGQHSAYIKIAEGCDHPCAFCVIPQFRGDFRSRRFESIVAEATRMFGAGVREINLIGQDTTSYGEDLGIKDGLATLLARLAQIETPFAKWVRFLYCYPNRVTPKLLETIAEHAALVKYIDMPLQHASRNVLKLMRRGSHGEQFLKLLEQVRKTIPGVTIRTSMIVGFPGETEADFAELCQFVEAAQFDRLGVFEFSDEETAKSYALEGKVDKGTIRKRQRRLMAIQRKISRKANKSLVGREFPILVEGVSPETELLWQGRLPGQAPEIDGVCLINDVTDGELKRGQIRRIRITEAHDYDLVGEVFGEAEALPAFAGAANPFPILNGPPRPQHLPL
ncbi:MAG: 30S ribosomal protein S12 methylthiotransferase RimO [Bryobacter sp.]|nr:30S ribosomal protein S12 methylthiotransferase RimO [Bryobacter sp.]